MNRILFTVSILIGLIFLSGFINRSDAQQIISISEARELPLGTTVTVAGWVTVTDEFEGPVYFQDETGGLAWYNNDLMRSGGFDLEVARGDSIVITGELDEFGQDNNEPGTGLLQIVGNNIEYQFFPDSNRELEPVTVSVQELNSNNFQGQLVQINDVTFSSAGFFQGNTNYTIEDASGSGQLRVDGRTDIPGAEIAEQSSLVIGVAGQFRSTAQILPRDRNDLENESIGFPGDDVAKDKTFDIVTWNIEWFGDSSRGPDNLDLQMNNVIEVIRTIDADLYALQEIADENRFLALVDSLEGFSGFWANYSQTQNTAYLFRTAVIDSVDSGLLSTDQTSFDWAGRLPLFFVFDAAVGDETRRVYSYNVHAKAFGDRDSYERRVNASISLKSYLDNYRNDDNVIFLGDYNDMLLKSSYEEAQSPYDNFVSDNRYFTNTLSLEERGFNSFLVGQFRSMIDHITVTKELIEDHISGAERVENISYIDSFTSTTSDHAPVWTRFDFSRNLVRIDTNSTERPTNIELSQNYPNPFNPATVIEYTLPVNSAVELSVFNMLGQRVAILVNEQMQAGKHEVVFDASGLSSGVYFYRLNAGNTQLTRKMTLIK